MISFRLGSKTRPLLVARLNRDAFDHCVEPRPRVPIDEFRPGADPRRPLRGREPIFEGCTLGQCLVPGTDVCSTETGGGSLAGDRGTGGPSEAFGSERATGRRVEGGRRGDDDARGTLAAHPDPQGKGF